MRYETVQEQAYVVGYSDARRGRLYRNGYNPGDRLRRLGLDAEYDAGWYDARNQVPPKVYV